MKAHPRKGTQAGAFGYIPEVGESPFEGMAARLNEHEAEFPSEVPRLPTPFEWRDPATIPPMGLWPPPDPQTGVGNGRTRRSWQVVADDLRGAGDGVRA